MHGFDEGDTDEAGIKWDGNGRGELKRMGCHGLANASWVFTWRARTSEGEYYLRESHRERKLYKVQSRREWRLDRKSTDDMADFVHSLPKGDRMILDSINDQVIVVTPVKIDMEKLLKEINAK